MLRWAKPIIGAIAIFSTLIWVSPTFRQHAIRGARGPDQHTSSEAAAVAAFGSTPMSFEANFGQTDPRVTFVSRGSGYTVYLTPTESVLSLRCPLQSRSN